MIDTPSQPANEGSHDDHQLGFPRFSDFPAEIRILIWECAIPDDVPEIHVLKPSSIRPHAYPSVDTAFPTVMHVSQEARESCVRRLTMRPCPDLDGLQVPYRNFRPELDIMFIGVFNFYAFFSRPEFFYGGMVRRLRHVAVDIVLATTANRMANVLQYLDKLETMSVVFGQPGHLHVAGQALPQGYAVQRCRLRTLTNAEYENTLVGDRPRPRDHQPVRSYLSDVRREIEHLTRQLIPTLDEQVNVGVWDYQKRKLKTEFKLNAQTLEEYQEGEWRARQRQHVRFTT
ncbi:hypothetical protein AB5N19_01099 [Seiridium cardinale]